MPTVSMPFKQYVRKFSRFPSAIQREVYRGLSAVAEQAKLTMDAATRSAPPASPNGGTGAVATGRYLNKWRAKRVRRANSVGVWIFNTRAYAQRIEYGRMAGARPPPVKAIAAWARVRLGASAQEARRIAWPISRAISKRGLKGRFVMSSDRTKMVLAFYMQESMVKSIMTATQKVFF